MLSRRGGRNWIRRGPFPVNISIEGLKFNVAGIQEGHDIQHLLHGHHIVDCRHGIILVRPAGGCGRVG
jgi:hypothetical protein